jgi:hypothetical protein
VVIALVLLVYLSFDRNGLRAVAPTCICKSAWST